MRFRNRRFCAVVETLIVMLGFHLFLLSLFRSYLPVEGRLGRSFLFGSLSMFALLMLRWRSSVPGDTPSSWRARMRPGHLFSGLSGPVLLLVACCLGVFVALQDYGGRVGNDGTMLYIYVRSVAMNGDLDLTNEFASGFVPEKFQYIVRHAEQAGRLPDPGQEIGPVFFWLPFFLAAHLLVSIANLFGAEIPPDGYSYPYVNAVVLGSFFWASFSVALSYRMVRRSFETHFSPWLVSFSAVVLWLASPLLWYTVFEPSMSHAVSAASVAIFLWAWLDARSSDRVKEWVVLALASGLMITVQRYNIFYLVAPACTLAARAWKLLRSMDRGALARAARVGGLCLGILVLASAPLWVVNLVNYGTLLRQGDQPATAIAYWSSPFWSQFLFSSNHGLFSTTPVAYLATIGLALLAWSRSRIALTLLLTVVCGIYLLSSTWDWYGGFAFGSRRLTEAYPVFLIGLTPMLQLLVRSPRFLAGILCSGLVVWNLSLMDQKRRGDIPEMSTFSFSDAAARGVARRYESLGYPAAAPANWLFAWAYGVPPGRFDRVWGHRPYNNLSVDVGTEADGSFLGRGWSRAERWSSGAMFRWSDGASSSWLVHLFDPYDYLLRLTGEPARSGSRERQSIAVEVNGERAGLITWPDGASSAEVLLPKQFFKAGLNEIVFQYGYTVIASDVYGGSDTRVIALRLERFDLTIFK